jgi:ABC-2 type transport system permease protein
MAKQKRKQVKQQNIIEFVVSLVIILLINYIASFLYYRIDLTAEKRFTLTDQTTELLKNLDDVVYFKVYLDGELPAGFSRLKNSTQEIIDEFRTYSEDNIQYEFINPSNLKDKKAQEELYRELYKKGLDPTNVQEKDEEGKTSQKIIFPGAIVSYRGKEMTVNLLKNNLSLSPEMNLNNSIQELEYEFVRIITRLNAEKIPQIAFLEGHGELTDIQVASITNELLQFYTVKRVKINGLINALKEFDAIIIAQPDTAFTEKDKFIIDQFIMHGGKSLWLIDEVRIDLDSLAFQNENIAMINNTNIDDQLFKYGVRVNPVLIQDLQCAAIPVNTALAGAPAKFEPAPWIFFPLISPPATHLITKNLNLLKTEFVNSLDTVGNDPFIKKTVLLSTSRYSKAIAAPARVSLDIMRYKQDPRMFANPNQPIAVLLEGEFESLYKNRLTPDIAFSKEIKFYETSKSTKMIVIGDGDIIKNLYRTENGVQTPYPIGFDRYTGKTYGNKEFILNTINYLCNDSSLLTLRAREIKLRMLDKVKASEERMKWQIINTVLPVVIVILFGILLAIYRKRKYSK